MQHAAAERDRAGAGFRAVIAGEGSKALCQRVMKGKSPLRRCRLPGEPLLPEDRQIEKRPLVCMNQRQGDRMFYAIRPPRQLFQAAGSFALPAEFLRRAAEGGGNGVE